jgi:hypothetical protein
MKRQSQGIEEDDMREVLLGKGIDQRGNFGITTT